MQVNATPDSHNLDPTVGHELTRPWALPGPPFAHLGAFKPLTREDVATILGVSVRTVENWRKVGRIPMSVDIGGRVYWHPTVFFEGLSATLTAKVQPASEPAASLLPLAPTKPTPRAPERSPAATRALLRQEAKLAAMVGGS